MNHRSFVQRKPLPRRRDKFQIPCLVQQDQVVMTPAKQIPHHYVVPQAGQVGTANQFGQQNYQQGQEGTIKLINSGRSSSMRILTDKSGKTTTSKKPAALSNLKEVKDMPLQIGRPKSKASQRDSPNPNGEINSPFHESSFDVAFDAFLVNASENAPSSLSNAMEIFFKDQLNASTVCYWEDISSLQILYSYSKNLRIRRDVGIAGLAFVSRSINKAQSFPLHPSFDSNIDGKVSSSDGPFICFPVFDFRNAIVGVVEVVRSSSSSVFTADEENLINHFVKKFKTLSRYIIQPQKIDPILLEIMQLMSVDQLILFFESRLTPYFKCRAFEIWEYNEEKDVMVRYFQNKTVIVNDHTGIVGEAIREAQLCNCEVNKLHRSYDPVIDTETEESVLVLPVIEATSKNKYAIVLRGANHQAFLNSNPSNTSSNTSGTGKNNMLSSARSNVSGNAFVVAGNAGGIFTSYDEEKLKSLAPYLALALSNASNHSLFFDQYQKSRYEQEGLTALLEVAEVLSSVLDIEKLTATIMEKGRLLTNADRCSLFLVNDAGDRLITSFQRGLRESIDIPINKGIAGKTVSEARILNIADAYEDPAFDPSTDSESGYRTKSILSVPIYNYRGEIIGVTEMVNKLDNRPFGQWDAKMIQIFNVFCGISLENARLYQHSLDMSQQLHSFFEVSFSLSKSENIQLLLTDIMQNARKVICAERASLFLVDPAANVLKSFIFDGGDVPPTLPLTTGIAASCAQTKEPLTVNDVYHDPRFNRSVDSSSGFRTNSVCVAPVITSDGQVMGVAEMVNKVGGNFTESDQKMLQSFAAFASVSLENSRLKDTVTLGSVTIEMQKYVGESERDKTDQIPVLLKLTEEQEQKIRILNFFAIEWDEIDKFKIIFSLFTEFGLLKEFDVKNEMLFTFLYEIRHMYHSVPYHNWIHAIDVSQYVSYEMRTAKLNEKFTKFEMFSILVAAVCHDAGHDGFNNIYNVKAETPLGILFKDQSVMETHHCSVAISILSRDECNLFHKISDTDIKKMWTLIIKLILSTDMAHHFNLVKTAGEILDKKEYNINVPEHRLLTMQLVLKVADISNVSRPFTLADKWCDVLNQEFFRQGDHEKQQGIGLTSPLNDREHPDKPKSQIGFYNFICIPLYQTLARMCPELIVNVNSVKANLEVWKSMMPPPKPEETK
ncbi:3'5'-cyclic nucleotide phosphodiesterase family protein [Tritrichomonas foetus]|uniref:3'5'-cyclic nucleotide phosphodiesterase family protein n=1 Tax=Tritrichomonas foetus TaxID=1144522 RepID=A0A1J4KSU4_9EUKA|nr:3'5'-cyclic nucleotide phosphodiesterase family protein [Tritrichomonas foetus]|eukprot:OHT14361.1 3'5'-cyclic nucleotide phosphodiesterase family protein [Tritrichomonas foetus]